MGSIGPHLHRHALLLSLQPMPKPQPASIFSWTLSNHHWGEVVVFDIEAGPKGSKDSGGHRDITGPVTASPSHHLGSLRITELEVGMAASVGWKRHPSMLTMSLQRTRKMGDGVVGRVCLTPAQKLIWDKRRL